MEILALLTEKIQPLTTCPSSLKRCYRLKQETKMQNVQCLLFIVSCILALWQISIYTFWSRGIQLYILGVRASIYLFEMLRNAIMHFLYRTTRYGFVCICMFAIKLFVCYYLVTIIWKKSVHDFDLESNKSLANENLDNSQVDQELRKRLSSTYADKWYKETFSVCNCRTQASRVI